MDEVKNELNSLLYSDSRIDMRIYRSFYAQQMYDDDKVYYNLNSFVQL